MDERPDPLRRVPPVVVLSAWMVSVNVSGSFETVGGPDATPTDAGP